MTNNLIASILADHKTYVLTISDIVALSIKDNQWLRIKMLLSPSYKFQITEPMMMPLLFEKLEPVLHNKLVTSTSIRLYIHYRFPGFEDAACREFLIAGAPYFKPQSVDLVGVRHYLSKHPDDPNNIFGIVVVENTPDSDTYNRLHDWLNELGSIRTLHNK